MRRIMGILGVASVLAASACGHFGFGGPGPDDALVIFHNESLDQADVYAISPGSDWIRIGTVLPNRADTLVVHSSLIGQGSGVNIVARLLASTRAPSTGNIPLRGGDMYDVRLPADERTLVALPARP